MANIFIRNTQNTETYCFDYPKFEDIQNKTKAVLVSYENKYRLTESEFTVGKYLIFENNKFILYNKSLIEKNGYFKKYYVVEIKKENEFIICLSDKIIQDLNITKNITYSDESYEDFNEKFQQGIFFVKTCNYVIVNKDHVEIFDVNSSVIPGILYNTNQINIERIFDVYIDKINNHRQLYFDDNELLDIHQKLDVIQKFMTKKNEKIELMNCTQILKCLVRMIEHTDDKFCKKHCATIIDEFLSMCDDNLYQCQALVEICQNMDKNLSIYKTMYNSYDFKTQIEIQQSVLNNIIMKSSHVAQNNSQTCRQIVCDKCECRIDICGNNVVGYDSFIKFIKLFVELIMCVDMERKYMNLYVTSLRTVVDHFKQYNDFNVNLLNDVIDKFANHQVILEHIVSHPEC